MQVLPRDPRERKICLATLANTFGNGLWLTGSALFLRFYGGFSATRVGLALSVAGVIGVLAGIPVGRFADSKDVRLLRVLSQLVQAGATLGLLFVHIFGGLLALLCLEALAGTANQVARGALIAAVAGRERRVALFSMMRAVANVGTAVGSAAAGLLIALDSRVGYGALAAVDSLSFLGSAAFLAAIGPVRPVPSPAALSSVSGTLRNPRFLAVVATTSILAAASSLLAYPLPLWIVGHTSAPVWFISVIVIGTSAVGVLLSGRASRGDNSFAPAARGVRAGAVGLALGISGFGLATFGPTEVCVPVLIAAAAVFAVGEVTVSVRGSAMAFAMSPDGQIGRYQGVSITADSVALAAAPALFALVLLRSGSMSIIGWVAVSTVMFGCGMIAPLLVPDR